MKSKIENSIFVGVQHVGECNGPPLNMTVVHFFLLLDKCITRLVGWAEEACRITLTLFSCNFICCSSTLKKIILKNFYIVFWII